MSEYGVPILNIQAGSIYECNLGVRDQLDSQRAMLSNSLFLDFLIDNGLKLWKDGSTRDVITVKFDYGSRSCDEDIKHINSLIARASPDDEKRLARLEELRDKAESKRDLYDKQSKYNLRKMFYKDGCAITYNTHNKSGEVIRSETIHYRMLYRTPGKAKQGSVNFICDRLYPKAREFLQMGITMPEQNAPLVEMGAYSSLITSSVVGRVKIRPENILVIKDVDSFMKTNVISIETNDARECVAIRRNDYRLKNTLFDGQALIDKNIFPEWGDGYILLRHHMCKMAAFCTDIQLFFRDYYGADYDTAYVKDYWGNLHKVSDVELITTENAMKWMKFHISYEYWCSRVKDNGCLFGVVKTSHPSKLGRVQRMSYQMVNALDYDCMDSIMGESKNYLTRLQTDDDEFLRYLDKNQNFSNDFDVLIALVEQNRDFLRSEYFRNRKKQIISAYVTNMKSGRLIQEADNLTIVGSPYAMLLHAVGEDPERDPTFQHEDGCIQCFTKRFNYGERLAEFRNPFNSRNNLGYLHNHYHYYFDRYFDFGKQIIAVNMIHTDFQDRNNGSDQDSDSLYVTNQPEIVIHAKHCYANYPTIINNIPKEQNHYSNTSDSMATIDHRLANSQLAIGESSNLAQICLSYTYNFSDRKYIDFVCILSVLAQVAIDSAKRSFDIDIVSEIKRIKKEMNISENLYPSFWTIIRPEFKAVKTGKNGSVKRMTNPALRCPMNYLYYFSPARHVSQEATLPMSEFFINYQLKDGRRKNKKVEELIQKYSLDLFKARITDVEDTDEYLLLRNDFEQMIDDIRQINISNNYLGLMSYLINRAFMITAGARRNGDSIKSNLNKNRVILMKTLYTISPKQFLQVFSRGVHLTENEGGETA